MPAAAMYELIIANKNYSSWSMRPWVLMRAPGRDASHEQEILAQGTLLQDLRAAP